MKTIIRFSFLLLFQWYSFSGFAQNCTPNGGFNSQAALDNFAALNPTCNKIDGNLIVSNLDNLGIINFNSLSQLDTITGNLIISGGYISMEGLNNLKYIGGDLIFINHDNAPIPNLIGLDNLSRIGGSLIFQQTKLTSLEGLDHLTEIGGDLVFHHSGNEIGSLSGFNVQTVGGDFIVYSLGESTNYEALAQLQRVKGNLDYRYSLPDNTLSGLSVVEGKLDARYSPVEHFRALSSLDSIYGDVELADLYLPIDIPFEGLGALKYVGGRFRTSDLIATNFRGFDSLNYIGGEFDYDSYLDEGSPRTFQGLEQLREIGQIKIEYAELDSLAGLNGLEIVHGPFVIQTATVYSLHRLEIFTTLEGDLYFNHVEGLENLVGLENLSNFGGNNFWLSKNPDLRYLEGLGYFTFAPGQKVTIKHNGKLQYCSVPTICEHVAGGAPNSTINANGEGCENKEEIATYCTNDFTTKLNTSFFYDLNQNKIQDPGEPHLPYFDIKISPPPPSIFRIQLEDYSSYLIDAGNYTVSFDDVNFPGWMVTTDSQTYHLNLDFFNQTDTIHFGIFPLEETSSLLSTISSGFTRCNEFVRYQVKAINLGTTMENGTLHLTIDPNIEEVNYIDQPNLPLSDPYTFSWDISDLPPGFSTTREISLKIPGPPDFALGDSLVFNSYVDNSPPLEQKFEMRCSYDPNDKLVYPARKDGYTLFGEDLFYTIRFQNTGNDTAFTVRIVDAINTNLDLSTLRITGTSHPAELTTSIQNGYIYNFEFDNILLPDSTTNFEESQGYVSFVISPKEGLAEETKIRNRAEIFFDQNPAIITNFTENIMVSQLPTTPNPVSSQTIGDEHFELTLFPNPTSDLLQVWVDQLDQATLRIKTLRGKVIIEQALQTQQSIDLSPYPAGLYLLRIEKEGYGVTKKLVKY